MEKRRAAAAVAAAAERAAAECGAREKEDAQWWHRHNGGVAADAERALDALRLEKEASERCLRLREGEERADARARHGGLCEPAPPALPRAEVRRHRADDRARDSEIARQRGSADMEGTRDDRTQSPARSSSELSGWSVPERVWQEILLEKESALSALSERDKAREDELTRLRATAWRGWSGGGLKEAKEASTPSPPAPGGFPIAGDHAERRADRGSSRVHHVVERKRHRRGRLGTSDRRLPGGREKSFARRLAVREGSLALGEEGRRSPRAHGAGGRRRWGSCSGSLAA